MTKRENFAELRKLAVASKNEELVAFIDHEVELLNKKNSYKSTKPTKTQRENEDLKVVLLGVMSAEPKTISDIQDGDETGTIGALSNQKISALLTQLIEAGKVVKTVEKRKAYFALAQ